MIRADMSLEMCVQNVPEGSDLLCKTLFLAKGPMRLKLGKDTLKDLKERKTGARCMSLGHGQSMVIMQQEAQGH